MIEKHRQSRSTKQDFCFILQPEADNQGSKCMFNDYRWIGPCITEKILLNDKYIVRRSNTNKTQILHQIRFKKWSQIFP